MVVAVAEVAVVLVEGVTAEVEAVAVPAVEAAAISEDGMRPPWAAVPVASVSLWASTLESAVTVAV